ncbi:uncharacterized protein LOC115760914 [Drosophila novamexicana]|uniref:uncharacterized protein LOC115760914 n=1 Tax=Drosophila novamexicana TaxID=47314 RepID=UPI0011E59237|nr:uncharacterized protein LOC115760914 [Drosophila novamexicana]
MADELLDPMEHSIDELRDQFERYKLRCAQLFNAKDDQEDKLLMEKQLQDLRADLEELRTEMTVLQIRQSDLIGWHDVDAIEDGEQFEADAKTDKLERTQLEEESDGRLIISCGSSPCVFEHCRRRVDSQLLLLHYLCDHNETVASQRCHKLCESQRVVLSFDTRSCHFKQNHVIGLLAFSGSPLQQQEQQLLTSVQEHEHLASDVPVVVLICKTAANSALKDKQLGNRMLTHANPKDQVFVIWLATPNDQLQLNAALRLCGRDAALQASTIVAVRQVCQSQDTCHFMLPDASHWRLTFGELKNISNNFRDELHLEIALTALRGRLFV